MWAPDHRHEVWIALITITSPMHQQYGLIKITTYMSQTNRITYLNWNICVFNVFQPTVYACVHTYLHAHMLTHKTDTYIKKDASKFVLYRNKLILTHYDMENNFRPMIDLKKILVLKVIEKIFCPDSKTQPPLPLEV